MSKNNKPKEKVESIDEFLTSMEESDRVYELLEADTITEKDLDLVYAHFEELCHPSSKGFCCPSCREKLSVYVFSISEDEEPLIYVVDSRTKEKKGE